MSTRGQLKSTIRENLDDANAVRFTDDDLNESFQDAYDDIAALTQCFTQRVTLRWESGLSYYDFKSIGVTDYLGTIAIFNNVNNQYLRDDLSTRDFDNLRRDWELWIGTPQFWAPISPDKIAIAAKYLSTSVNGAFNPYAFSSAYFIGGVAVGTFDLTYSTTAPTVTDDATSPLIASDMQVMFEYYMTADMLEQDEEFAKANVFFTKYYECVRDFSKRVKVINKHDLLLRV